MTRGSRRIGLSAVQLIYLCGEIWEAPKSYSIRLGTVRQRDLFVPKLQAWSRSERPSLATIRKIERQGVANRVTITRMSPAWC